MVNKLYGYLKIYGPKLFLKNVIGELRMIGRGPLQNSYSQNSEDIFIDDILGNKKVGFYVDVGAYDPTRLSNTKRFYLRGWSGINIEPDPKKITRFYKHRPRDINLNLGIANKIGKLTYYKFQPETLSTFSSQAANGYKKEGFKLIGTSKISVRKLSDIFSGYCNDKHIDFLSVDVEGYDFEVLKSNDWKKYRPTLICVESNPISDMAIESLFTKVGYKKVGKNHNNLIFMNKSA